MMLVGGDSVWYLHLAARRGPDITAEGMNRAYFECSVDEVLVDKVTYATITSGITFELPDPEAVLARWQRTIDLVGAAGPVAGRPADAANQPDDALPPKSPAS